MMKKGLLISFILSGFLVYGQEKLDETVYLHVNSTNVLTGESLHFSAYARSESSGEMIDLSRLLYVELIDRKGESRLQEKVELIDGRGDGRLFIPLELETGVFQLVAYTRWMKNTPSWYRQPLTIINPYKSYSASDSLTDQAKLRPLLKDQMITQGTLPSYEKSSAIHFEENIGEASTLSVSVSRINDLSFRKDIDSVQIVTTQKEHDINYYPEYQYGIIQGKSKFTDFWVSSSFQSNEMEVDVLKLDPYGNFLLYYDPSNISTGVGSLISNMTWNGNLDIYPEFYDGYPSFRNPSLEFSDSILADIKARSIHSQLMNAYRDLSASISEKSSSAFLPGDDVRVFVLDEYKRFSSMRNTFIELIFEVAASKNEKNFDLSIRSEYIGTNKAQRKPLILLDGIWVSGKEILGISPYLVEKIEIVTEDYFIGEYAFHGIISVHTFKNDFGGADLSSPLFQILPTQKSQNLSSVKVDIEKLRHPRLEHLLYWDPQVEHPGGDLSIDFYSSNFSGVYEMSIRGVTTSGESVSVVRYFRVE